MANWYFPSNENGEQKGINDSGIATFRGTPLKSLAREICQNSIDAACDPQNPVRVDFSCFAIPSNDVPGVDDLKDACQKSLAYWDGQKGRQTKDFFTKAYDTICKDTVNVLRISDFNTTGLTGSEQVDVKETDWMRLTKSSGSSDKGQAKGGSYGIGKYAPFACSHLSTVFYSTYDNEDKCAYQGVARLVTFKRDDGETTQGTGYFGNAKNTPVFEQLTLDPAFKRDPGDYGTDVYILGYRFADGDWVTDIVVSILDSFLVAIWKEKLIVDVGGVRIDKQALPALLEEYGGVLDGTYVLEYYQVLTSAETKWFEENLLGLGKVKLGYLLSKDEKNDKFHRKVSLTRKTGMKIKDGDHINGYISFAGALFIEGEEINERLRLIENPAHTEWEPERMDDKAKENEAKSLVKSIFDYMKRCLDELIRSGTDNEIDAAGAGNYIRDVGDDDNGKNKDETISDAVVEIVKKKVERTPKAVDLPKEDDTGETEAEVDVVEGGSGEDWLHGDEPGDNPHVDPPRPPQPVDYVSGTTKKITGSKEIKLQQFRYIVMNPDRGEYMVDFVPSCDSDNGMLKFNLSGETDAYPVEIVSAELINKQALQTNGNTITGLTFRKGQNFRFKMKINYTDFCAMEVKAYDNKK